MYSQAHHSQMQIPVHTVLASNNANNMFETQHHYHVPVTSLEGQQQETGHHQVIVQQQQPQTNEIYIRQPVEAEAIVSLEQCCVCSTYYEAPARPIPHPDLNRIITKVLDVTPTSSFYKDYVALCVNCTNLLRKFDRLRVELEFTKTQLVTYVVESLTQIRSEGGSQLDGLKGQILDRWTSGQKGGKKKGKEGFSAAGGSGDLSWAAHNNVMKKDRSTTATASTANLTVSTEVSISPDTPGTHEGDDDHYPSDDDNDHGEDDLLHAADSDNDNEIAVSEKVEVIERKVNRNRKDDVNALTNNIQSDITSPPKRKRKKRPKKKRAGEGVAPLICTNCGRIFGQRVSYNGHVQACTSDDLGMEKNCTICAEEENEPCIFETWEDLKSHVNHHHPFVKLEACANCRVNFLPNGIKMHNCVRPYRSKVDKEAIFQCDRCDKSYNTRANLVDHVRRLHKDEQHKCDICDKVYGSPMLLSHHVKQHSRVVSKFQCKECGVCTTTNYGLKQHMKRHTGELPYDCQECGRKFSSLSILRLHKSVHQNSKPFSCHICGKCFKIKSTLSRHVARHELDVLDVNKKCPICPKGVFRKVYALKQHMKTKHPDSTELDEILEKYKDVDDAPRSMREKAARKLKRKKSESDDYDDDEEEDAIEEEFPLDELSDEDVKPSIDGDDGSVVDTAAEAATSSATVSSSRQSARLMGKCKTKKLVIVLTKESS